MKSQFALAVAAVVLGCGVALSHTATAADQVESAVELAAQTENAWASQEAILRKNAQVHSDVQLRAYLAKAAKDSSQPINMLSAPARARFVDSLRFNENGVTSFYYADIESELSASQAYDLLSVFGLQSTIGLMPKLRVQTPEDREMMGAFGTIGPGRDDHNDYWCSSRATCSRNVGSICMSGC